VNAQRGLTLVEVLVVSAILVLLFAIATAGSLRAISSAKKRSCVSQLRSIHQALTLYRADHADVDPPYAIIAHTNGVERHAEYKASLEPYGLPGDTFYCPSDRHARTDFIGEWHTHKEMSYTHGPRVTHLARTQDDTSYWFSIARVENPSDFHFMYDQTRLEPQAEGRPIRLTAHGTRANVLMADGSVQSLPVP
jgi:prepilin-type N-terminal cleavage/methylation domain-containing protein/prepilin-type processing-associated H-X9-DG protein